MKVTIELGAWALRYVGQRSVVVDLDEGATVADATSKLTIPTDEVGIVTLKGEVKNEGYVLSDGDIITVFPVVLGG